MDQVTREPGRTLPKDIHQTSTVFDRNELVKPTAPSTRRCMALVPGTTSHLTDELHCLLRRRLRVLLSSVDLPPGLYLIGARPGAAERSYIELTFDVERLLRRLPHVAVPPVS